MPAMTCANPACKAVSDTPMWRKGWTPAGSTSAVHLCNACGILYKRGWFCPWCTCVYRKSAEHKSPWLGCDYCDRWVHIQCEQENDQDIALEGEFYACPECRARPLTCKPRSNTKSASNVSVGAGAHQLGKRVVHMRPFLRNPNKPTTLKGPKPEKAPKKPVQPRAKPAGPRQLRPQHSPRGGSGSGSGSGEAFDMDVEYRAVTSFQAGTRGEGGSGEGEDDRGGKRRRKASKKFEDFVAPEIRENGTEIVYTPLVADASPDDKPKPKPKSRSGRRHPQQPAAMMPRPPPAPGVFHLHHPPIVDTFDDEGVRGGPPVEEQFGPSPEAQALLDDLALLAEAEDTAAAAPPPPVVAQIQARSVREFLHQLGLHKYAPVFEAQDIGMDMIPHMSEKDLLDVPIHCVGSRRKLLAHAAALR